jgi:hypothetical protein
MISSHFNPFGLCLTKPMSILCNALQLPGKTIDSQGSCLVARCRGSRGMMGILPGANEGKAYK